MPKRVQIHRNLLIVLIVGHTIVRCKAPKAEEGASLENGGTFDNGGADDWNQGASTGQDDLGDTGVAAVDDQGGSW